VLKFQLTPYADASWQQVGGGYCAADGASHVTPIDHEMVEHTAVTDGKRTLIIIREAVTGRTRLHPALGLVAPREFDEREREACAWPADFVLIHAAPSLPVTVSAGAARTTPLYLAADTERLYGSWEMADLKAHAGRLHAVEAARRLVFRPRYSTQTVFEGIHRLTERATAHFGGSLWISYPAPALHHDPRELAEGADVLGVFTALLGEALDAHPWAPERTVFHLSAGFDSGCIAATAALSTPGAVRTAALLIDGPGRAQQEARRGEMRRVLPFAEQDVLVDAAVNLPLDARCARVRGEAISLYEEPLHYPFALLTGQLAEAGGTTLVTGLGGDELVALSEAEAPHLDLNRIAAPPPWLGKRAKLLLEYGDVGAAPPAQINSMTLLALETTAPPLLRAGIYPIHPFAYPPLVEFGEQLPFVWRDFKALQRRLLAGYGLSELVVHPVERESFAEIVQAALAGQGVALLESMLEDGSVLFDEDLVDPDELSGAIERIRCGRYEETAESKVFEVVHQHLAAAAFL
jgi:asparagine synthase (glutamine-hydrolysing)